jgi:hypothetical protein
MLPTIYIFPTILAWTWLQRKPLNLSCGMGITHRFLNFFLNIFTKIYINPSVNTQLVARLITILGHANIYPLHWPKRNLLHLQRTTSRKINVVRWNILNNILCKKVFKDTTLKPFISFAEIYGRNTSTL